jgi:hypothetical protein
MNLLQNTKGTNQTTMEILITKLDQDRFVGIILVQLGTIGVMWLWSSLVPLVEQELLILEHLSSL